jgi:hypothetical protein
MPQSSSTVPALTEPHISFRHAVLKVNWAKENLKVLSGACRAFIDTKPYSVSLGRDSSGEADVLGATFHQPVPFGVCLLAGDIVGNLRASLDYAWMGLFRSIIPVPSSGKRTLPIANNRAGLLSTIRSSEVGQAFPQVEELLVDRIRCHQDFASGGSREVTALNCLSNRNKHNLILLTVGQIGIASGSIGGIEFRDLGVLGNGKPLVVVEGADEPTLNRLDEVCYDVVFSGGDQQEMVADRKLIPTLSQFHAVCRDALREFCETFPSPHNPKFT